MRCYENSGWLTSLTEFFGKGVRLEWENFF